MSKATRFARLMAAVAGLGAAVLTPAAFAGGNIIIGTTDTVHTVDPARCYDFYCANILHNVGQTLVSYPPGSSKIAPELVKSMPGISKDGLTYTFKLRQGIKFQNGSKLTSKDVKFSLDRALWINDPEGAGFLLADMKQIDTPDPTTVVIHLKTPDVSFVSKLAYTVATILPSDVYTSPNKPIPNDAKPGTYRKFERETFVGSGPYKIANFTKDQSMLLTTWKGYSGNKPSNDKVLVRFYAKSSQMLVALKSGEIDVAFRSFTPAQTKSLENSSEINEFKGKGASIRYLVFNPNLEPSKSLKVRRAVAAAMDRDRIVKNVLDGAAEPLYSMVPPAFGKASVPAFNTRYGGKKASDYIDHKVKLTLWYSRGHYGDTETAFAQTVKRELEETNLFNVTLKSAEWAQFTASAYPASTGQYAAFLMGWYPDYLDPDDYLAPFYASKDSFLRVYNNKHMDQLLGDERTASGPSTDSRLKTFAEIQQLAARDVPIVPLYVVTPFAYARKDISGVAKTMGPAQIFRYWVLSKNGG
ncbi:MAG: ABC transporter substrate-binding protein [Salinisphaera sp.]|jgi:peptide/nickel transport system substrate-binding protein|nr:ABC transporter substrate-binding protein [Salinisphaera sp.]